MLPAPWDSLQTHGMPAKLGASVLMHTDHSGRQLTNREGTETPLAFKTETAPCSMFLDGLVHVSISACLTDHSPHPPPLYIIRKVNLCPKVGHMFLSLLPGSREEGTSVGHRIACCS